MLQLATMTAVPASRVLATRQYWPSRRRRCREVDTLLRSAVDIFEHAGVGEFQLEADGQWQRWRATGLFLRGQHDIPLLIGTRAIITDIKVSAGHADHFELVGNVIVGQVSGATGNRRCLCRRRGTRWRACWCWRRRDLSGSGGSERRLAEACPQTKPG